MGDKDLLAMEQLLTTRSLSSFTPGSELYYYFSLLGMLQAPLSQSFTDMMEKFASAYPDSLMVKRIRLRTLVKRYEETKDAGQKKELLAKLNAEYLRLSFDAPAPTTSSEATLLYPTVLDPSLLLIDIPKGESSLSYFRSLSQEDYRFLDVARMTDDVFSEFSLSAQVHLYPGVVPRLANELQARPSSRSLQCVTRLTLDQLQALVERSPGLKDNEEVVAALYVRLFPVAPTASPKDRVATLAKALEWTRSLSPKFVGYRQQLIFEMLNLMAGYGEYREDLFVEYLRLHGAGPRFVTKENHVECPLPNSTVSRMNDGAIIDAFLEKILPGVENVSQFSPYLSLDYLAKAFARAKILSGSDPTALSLSASELEALSQEVILQLSPENPKVFPRASEVTLQIFTKNVPTLIVKVLELNALAYSLATLQAVPETIDFDGLEATYQEVYDYSQDPVFVRKGRDLPVPWLKGKSGLFAIELFGNGLHARALIKKGCLKLVSKVTAAGHQMTVLNEENVVCAGQGAGVYVDSRLYELKEEKKSVIVPFSGEERMNVAVVTDGVVCDVASFLHRAETYDLQCAFILMEESLKSGAMASVSVLPKLFVSGLPGPKDLLKDPSVTIVTLDLDGISSSKKYSQLTIPAGEELITMEFEVPSKAVIVQLVFACEVTPMAKPTPVTLTANRRFQINQTSGTISCKQVFLRRAEGDFYVQVLGRNGELCAKQIVSMTFEVWGKRSVQDCLLSTNEDGLVKLGPLDSVTRVMVVVMEDGGPSEVQNSWSLTDFRPCVQYPQQLTLCEGDSFGIPFSRKGDRTAPLSQFEAELREFDSAGQIISASSSRLTYDPVTEAVVLSGLSEGKYAIALGTETEIALDVHKGVHWGSNQYILTDTHVIQTYKQYRSLMVSSAARRENLLDITLAGDYQSAVVHVLLHNFLSESVKATYCSLAQMTTGRPCDAIATPDAQSKYTKSRVLSQEYRYVLERKLQEKFTGNNLPKPQLLLKPCMTKETASSRPLGGASRESKFSALKSARAAMCPSMMPMSSMTATESSNCMDFLLTPATVKLSCPVAEDGKVTIELPDGDFTLASVIALNSDSTALLTTDLQSLSLKTKDLALRLRLDVAKTYAETRKCSVLRTGEDLTIADIAAASLQVIDSVDKLSQLLVQVSKLSGAGLDVQEWDFLGRWHLLSAEEKKQKYDKYCSHELNLFLYMKDSQYFETVVKPFLATKMEKQLVDHFLLGDSLDSFVQLDAIQGLNCLEKALLVHRNEAARGLIASMVNQAKVLPKDEAAEQKLFDAVLKFNIEGSEKDELSQFLAEEKKLAQEEALRMQQNQSDLFDDFAMADIPSDDCYMEGQMASVDDCQPCCESAPVTKSCAMPMFAMTRGAVPQPEFYLFSRSMPKKSIKRTVHSSKREGTIGVAPEEGEDDCFMELGPEDILQQREEQRPYFQQMDATKEYAETHYYGLKNLSEFSSRVPLSVFWADVVQSAGAGSLSCLSPSVLHATSNVTTYVAALALTDLPLQANRHGFVSHGLGVRIKASSNFFAFHKSMDEAVATLQDSALCTQRFFHPKERYITNAAGEKEEKPVKEFVAGTVYGSQVIVTNVSVVGLPAHVLVQVPEGAIPIATLDYTKSHLMLLKAYETKTLEYHFYFPGPGEYVQAPINVSVNGEVICVSSPFRFRVAGSRSLLSSDSLKDIAASGDVNLAIAFLQTHNPHTPEVNMQLNSLLWMLKDKVKYCKLKEALRQQQCFHRGVWGYAFLHEDEEAIKELLATESSLRNEAGYFLTSSLLTTDCLEARHLDYNPMVNARAYRLASQPRIANEQFKSTYYSFLYYLSHKPVLESADYMALIQYMLYQDRIPEAKRLIPNVGLRPSEGAPGTTPLQLQFDYLMCYLDAEVGRTVAPLYANYPIPMWRNLFEMVRKQFEDERDDKVIEKESLSTSLSFTVEGGRVKLTYANLTQVTVRLYEIDIEVLFSRNPFFMKDTELFTYVCPNATYHLELNPKNFEHEFELEDKWTRSNIFVEVEYDGKKLFQVYYSSSLTVHVIEQYGLVHVLDSSSHGVPRIYVKVFSKDKSGQTIFYKDGYTDVRGKFDYVSLNTNQLDLVDSFAMLITHDSLGAAIVTAKPPAK